MRRAIDVDGLVCRGDAVGLKELLQGRGPKAMRDMVALNAGLAIFLVEQGATLDECMAKGRAAVEQAAGRGFVHA